MRILILFLISLSLFCIDIYAEPVKELPIIIKNGELTDHPASDKVTCSIKFNDEYSATKFLPVKFYPKKTQLFMVDVSTVNNKLNNIKSICCIAVNHGNIISACKGEFKRSSLESYTDYFECVVIANPNTVTC